MPLRVFFGKTESELLVILQEAQNDLASGKTISGAGAGDVSYQNVIQMDPKERIRLALFELNQLDPVTYPASVAQRVSRTRVTVHPYDDSAAIS